MHSNSELITRPLDLSRAAANMAGAANVAAGGLMAQQIKRETVGERLDEQIKFHAGKAEAARGLKGALSPEVLASDSQDFLRTLSGAY